ncbi:hypothetical protein EAO73_26335 [Streptomyces sp. col6]|nr:hypothetical protein EAO73_26335 [Streptomyces sp. col6]
MSPPSRTASASAESIFAETVAAGGGESAARAGSGVVSRAAAASEATVHTADLRLDGSSWGIGHSSE